MDYSDEHKKVFSIIDSSKGMLSLDQIDFVADINRKRLEDIIGFLEKENVIAATAFMGGNDWTQGCLYCVHKDAPEDKLAKLRETEH